LCSSLESTRKVKAKQSKAKRNKVKAKPNLQHFFVTN